MAVFKGVNIELSGNDGNAFLILGRAIRAAQRAGIGSERIEEFRTEATSDDYDHLLRTVMKYFETS